MIIVVLTSLTSWYSFNYSFIITTMILWECCNTSIIICTKLYWAKRVAGVSSGGVNDHYTSVHVGNSEVVGEITEYTSCWWRVPHDGTEWWTEPQVENTTNTCVYLVTL